MRCNGSEISLDECPLTWNHPTSTNYRDFSVAGVICQGNETFYRGCNDGDLRLIGGESENEGRVEICIDGYWGNVCNQDWDQRDAYVVCRQAGFQSIGMKMLNTVRTEHYKSLS